MGNSQIFEDWRTYKKHTDQRSCNKNFKIFAIKNKNATYQI